MTKPLTEDAANRLDSGMQPEDRGYPVTMREISQILKRHNMDDHHRFCFQFLLRRVERLEEELKEARDEIDTHEAAQWDRGSD